jgi:hypothetical protein
MIRGPTTEGMIITVPHAGTCPIPHPNYIGLLQGRRNMTKSGGYRTTCHV